MHCSASSPSELLIIPFLSLNLTPEFHPSCVESVNDRAFVENVDLGAAFVSGSEGSEGTLGRPAAFFALEGVGAAPLGGGGGATGGGGGDATGGGGGGGGGASLSTHPT